MERKILTLTFLFFFALKLNGQERKLSIGVEYSPNISSIENATPENESKISYQSILRFEFTLKKNLLLTTGVGYLNTGDKKETQVDGQFDIDKIAFNFNYNYIVMPIGLKYYRGSFFLQPELGIAYNLSNERRNKVTFVNGDIQSFKEDINDEVFSKITIPSSLIIGYEYALGSIKLLLGIKGYYSLTKLIKERMLFETKNYYGFGIMTGIKF